MKKVVFPSIPGRIVLLTLLLTCFFIVPSSYAENSGGDPALETKYPSDDTDDTTWDERPNTPEFDCGQLFDEIIKYQTQLKYNPAEFYASTGNSSINPVAAYERLLRLWRNNCKGPTPSVDLVRNPIRFPVGRPDPRPQPSTGKDYEGPEVRHPLLGLCRNMQIKASPLLAALLGTAVGAMVTIEVTASPSRGAISLTLAEALIALGIISEHDIFCGSGDPNDGAFTGSGYL